MQPHSLVAIVTILALLVYFWMGIQVAGSRRTSGIQAPAMTGHPLLDRAVRVHYNTLEWLPTFLVSMWLFAIYWRDDVAAGLGVVWIVGRLIYSFGYMSDPGKRGTGFLIQTLATAILLFGALGRLVYVLVTVGA